MMNTLHWLEFEWSEDAAGAGSFDAMASATPERVPELQAEVVRVLAWAASAFGPPQPLDEGGEWDFDLHGVQEVATALSVHWHPGSAALDLQPGATGAPRVTLSLTLTGSPAFCDAFRQAFPE